MKIGRIRVFGNYIEVENADLTPEEIDRFEKLIRTAQMAVQPSLPVIPVKTEKREG